MGEVLRPRFKSKKTVEDTKDTGGNKPRVGDLVEVFKHPDKKWSKHRLTGPCVCIGMHWIKTKRKDGSEAKFGAVCLRFDGETESFDSTKECPWCDANDKRISFRPEYYQNSIVRALQESKPAKIPELTEKEEETRFKEKESDSWTPVRVVRLTPSGTRKLKRLASENRHKSKKTGEMKAWPLSHDFWGTDVKMYYDKDDKTPANMYDYKINEETTSPLTDEEKEYLLWDIEGLNSQIKAALKDCRSDYERWAEKMGKSSDEDEEDDKPKKKKKSSDDDEEEDSSHSSKSSDDEDDEDDKPKKKKKSSDDDDDDFEEEKPKKKKRDEEEEEDDEEEDEKPKKKKKKEEDEEDEDGLDFDDEDDDDKPKKKKKKDEDEEDDE